MIGIAGKTAAVAIVIAEIVSIGTATAAQRQKYDQRQQIIVQQQKQIQKYQRLLEAQQRQITSLRSENAGAADSASGSAGNVFDCPPHYYHSFVRGCLPDLRYLR